MYVSPSPYALNVSRPINKFNSFKAANITCRRQNYKIKNQAFGSFPYSSFNKSLKSLPCFLPEIMFFASFNPDSMLFLIR